MTEGPATNAPKNATLRLEPAQHAWNGRHRRPRSTLSGRILDVGTRALSELLSLLAPAECVCCGHEDTSLCVECAGRLRALCVRPFRAEQESPVLMELDGGVRLAVVAAGPYRDELAQVMLSFKKHGQPRLAEALAPLLGKALSSAAGRDPGLCLVPVPSSGAAFRRRGFSPVELLLATLRRHGRLASADTIHGLRKRPDWFTLHAAVLGQIPWVGAAGGQKGLGRGARARRVRGSMQARRWPRACSVKGRRCVIIDDVLTTGATLAEAARAIEAAGGTVCGAVVLAATRPPAVAATD